MHLRLSSVLRSIPMPLSYASSVLLLHMTYRADFYHVSPRGHGEAGLWNWMGTGSRFVLLREKTFFP